MTKRFNEDEAAEIFRRAAELEQRQPQMMAPRDGMTVAELQEIGREAGLDPALVARAAALAPETHAVPIRRILGIPVGVGHPVELDRALSDAEWEQLVVDLRETFDARGVMRVEGGFRQWTNGNLQVLVEPVGVGHRIRFRTVHGQARQLMTLGGIFFATSAVMGAMLTATGGPGFAGMIGLGGAGAGLFAVGAARLPGWARVRREQMEAVAERVVARQIERHASGVARYKRGSPVLVTPLHWAAYGPTSKAKRLAMRGVCRVNPDVDRDSLRVTVTRLEKD